MQLDTRHFGLIEVEEKDIIDFPEGVPGFTHVKKFVLLGKIEEEAPFQWLQGVDDPDLAFVVIQPMVFMPEYEVNVEDSQVDILGIKDTEKVLIYSIVVVPENIMQMTANLKAPVLINTENNRGKQVMMENNEYKIKHLIMQELRKTGGKE